VLYAGVSTAQKVTTIYLVLFNRTPEPVGLAYWASQIDSGTLSQAQAAYQIQSSAGPGDPAAVANKLVAAKAFTALLDTGAEIAGYSGAAAATFARSFLSSVDATPASLAIAIAPAALESSVVAVVTQTALVIPIIPTSPSSQTYTLTGNRKNQRRSH